jgi:hypothetical protein
MLSLLFHRQQCLTKRCYKALHENDTDKSRTNVFTLRESEYFKHLISQKSKTSTIDTSQDNLDGPHRIQHTFIGVPEMVFQQRSNIRDEGPVATVAGR